ncbi:DUF262 domain-containing protein [uncultured Phascolarctobacterium sp.]|jgi:hypothetical protein|uniref:DUF262 domain-containing protein n=1 Tax=uncultured Phascolarctobacterium sp. TaxID=512296 RepID=UPI0025E409AD|nr:DUF262 domain-containing protein [uncultured Phascolarctobacterium sp.]
MDYEKKASISSKQISEKKQEIKYDTRDYVIGYLVNQFEEEEFYVPREYQRNFIWTNTDKSYFIESVLMGLPIPFMFFADTSDGKIEIVDGAQRTQTLVQFAQNELKLNDLEILTDSNGLSFSDLDIAVQRRFLNTNIRVVYLEEGTTKNVRQEIFKRINTSGRLAKPAEIRRGSFDGPFKVFLEECVQNELFQKLAPRSKEVEYRYEGFELVLRFFAYTDSYQDDFNNYDGNVAKFLDRYLKQKNKAFDDKTITNSYKMRFEKMLKYTEKLLGERGFRKSLKAKSTPRARFEALAVGISIALEENPELPVRDASWIDDEDFLIVTKSDAANNKSNLKRRINFVKDKLMGENDG